MLLVRLQFLNHSKGGRRNVKDPGVNLDLLYFDPHGDLKKTPHIS
jgi:hypothetical protein